MAQAGLATELSGRWQRLVSRWGARAEKVDAEYAELVARYAEPHRRYHTLEHIAEALVEVDTAHGSPEVELAVWFHDAIYDTAADDNEHRSAQYADAVLSRLGAPLRVIAEVKRLVELTATHVVPPADVNARVLIDADLAILRANPARYDRYVDDVRHEYAHVDDDAWTQGRAAVVRSLLAVTTDAAARSNLTRELTRLSSSPPQP